jgi:hypothetical protein
VIKQLIFAANHLYVTKGTTIRTRRPGEMSSRF